MRGGVGVNGSVSPTRPSATPAIKLQLALSLCVSCVIFVLADGNFISNDVSKQHNADKTIPPALLTKYCVTIIACKLHALLPYHWASDPDLLNQSRVYIGLSTRHQTQIWDIQKRIAIIVILFVSYSLYSITTQHVHLHVTKHNQTQHNCI